MAYSRMMSELDFTRAQLAFFTIIIMLALDQLNPIKIFLHVFPNIANWHVATFSALCIIYIWVTELKPLLYFSVKVFFHSIISIFFREVQVIGLQNIPNYGPVIFTGNHANQFIDAVVMMATCPHKISYMIAEKSWKRAVVGSLAWAMGAVPVKRAQDTARKGLGMIYFEELSQDLDDSSDGIRVHGDEDTLFTQQVHPKDKIRITVADGNVVLLKVEEVIDDNHLTVACCSALQPIASKQKSFKYDVLDRVDQSLVYEKVLDKLASGGSIGMFPEGGSHDRTDLLPLKVGVALIAYSALEKDDLCIPIVPVGLNYFRAHRFRGRAVVEYGSPTYVNIETLSDYKEGGELRRKVCNDLLQRIEDSMRSVLVTTPDYESLQMIYAARRLYQRKEPDALRKQDMNRRFAEGYKELLQQVNGSPPQDWLDLQDRIINYHRELRDLGISDYQVVGLAHEKLDNFQTGDAILREVKLPFTIIHLLGTILLTLVPAVFLNWPVGLIARLYSERKRIKALQASKVKVKGMDVKLSEKVLLCIVLVPTLWVTYGWSLYFFSDLDGPTIALCILSMPLFSYLGIMTTEAGMVDLKEVRPHVMRLIPSSRRRLMALPAKRSKLQADLRAFVKEVGPRLGDIYHENDLIDWKSRNELQRSRNRTRSEEQTEEEIQRQEFRVSFKNEKDD